MNADLATPFAATVDRPLLLRARSDTQVTPVQFSGQTAFVLKDPLTLEIFHLTAEEFFLFEKLKQPVALKSLQQAFQARFTPRQISSEQLQQGVNQLYRQGLLLSEAAGQGDELRERADRRRHTERWQSCFKLLSFRVGSIDATRTVDGLYKISRSFFTFPSLVFVLCLFAYALSILLGHGSEALDRLPSLAELSQPRYWLLWLETIATVKVIHELAHAVTCKHFGGRCHEIGLLLLAMMPCLYCDVTDVWRLPSKWQRIAVSSAGMLAELVIASVALIVWWHTEPGLLQSWSLSVVIVCSIGTLLVNANPLLRYDGYYLLSDLVEVPNLADRARGLLPATLQRWLMAEPAPQDALLSVSQRRGLGVYALAARVYMTLVMLAIFIALLAWASPYRLENLIYTLGVVTLAGMLFSPLMGVWHLLRNPAQRFRLRRLRVASFSLVIMVLVAAFFLMPLSRVVQGPALFVPANGQPVFATTGGELQFALPPGTPVKAGDVLVRLYDPISELALVRQQGEFEVRQVRLQQLDSMRAWNERASSELPAAQAAVEGAAAQLKQRQAKAKELVIRATTEGVVVAAPNVLSAYPRTRLEVSSGRESLNNQTVMGRAVNNARDESQLAVWSGSALEARNLGCWVEPGTMLCMVANPGLFEVLVSIDQSDVAEIQPGQSVRILLESSPVRILRGEVVQVARRSIDRAPSNSTVNTGKYHLVQVRLSEQDPSLLVGSRGTAKIVARRSTLSQRVASQLQGMFRFPW